MKKTPSKDEVLEKLVQNLQSKKVYVNRKDKKIIPTCVDDLPPNLRNTSHREYKKAYFSLWYKMNKKPTPTIEGKVVKKGRWSANDSVRVLELWKLGFTTTKIMNEVGRNRASVLDKVLRMREKEGITMSQFDYRLSLAGLNDWEESNTPTKVVTTPPMLAETPKASPMKGYKQVARTGRVGEDTFNNLVKEYAQVFNMKSITLTPEGATTVIWEVKS